MRRGHHRENVQRNFLKFTAQTIKGDLKKHHPQVLEQFRVNAKDRTYQFWERNPLSIELWTEKVLWQKLNYLHQNPVQAGLCRFAEEYRYSSAAFYHTGMDKWSFLSHVLGKGLVLRLLVGRAHNPRLNTNSGGLRLGRRPTKAKKP